MGSHDMYRAMFGSSQAQLQLQGRHRMFEGQLGRMASVRHFHLPLCHQQQLCSSGKTPRGPSIFTRFFALDTKAKYWNQPVIVGDVELESYDDGLSDDGVVVGERDTRRDDVPTQADEHEKGLSVDSFLAVSAHPAPRLPQYMRRGRPQLQEQPRLYENAKLGDAGFFRSSSNGAPAFPHNRSEFVQTRSAEKEEWGKAWSEAGSAFSEGIVEARNGHSSNSVPALVGFSDSGQAVIGEGSFSPSEELGTSVGAVVAVNGDGRVNQNAEYAERLNIPSVSPGLAVGVTLEGNKKAVTKTRKPPSRKETNTKKAGLSGSKASTSRSDGSPEGISKPIALATPGSPQYTNKEVLIVDSVDVATEVVKLLRGLYRDKVHACDTEVAGIDVKRETPIGHGRIICFSIYCGPDVDFGQGKSRLWVDVLDGGDDVLDIFKAYFEDPDIAKVWHNYSFDYHILCNHGIQASGFYADTMHLARLWDSSRTGEKGGYSLEALTSDKLVMDGKRELSSVHRPVAKTQEGGLLLPQTQKILAAHADILSSISSFGKISMKDMFGKPNVKKDGSEGKLKVIPPVEELQKGPERDKWIHYSSFDAVCTWRLWFSLREKLKAENCQSGIGEGLGTLYEFYSKYWQPFGQLLVQMECDGMLVDVEYLKEIEKTARNQQKIAEGRFRSWAAKRCPDAAYMNVGSDTQIRQLLFGGMQCRKDSSEVLPMERTFNVPNVDGPAEDGKKLKKTRPIVLRGLGVRMPCDTHTGSGWPTVSGAFLKSLAGKVAIDYSIPEETEDALSDIDDTEALSKDAPPEDVSVYGKAYHAFKGGEEGKEACMAFAALCEVAAINTLLSNFIEPLQGDDVKGPDGRVHCSLNINTETGRLSARRPSLQNQPALEKDRYKIRQAFIASSGNSLVVADYGQLELRLLAHLASCKSMREAFEAGGDFHSRTAMNMYTHVRNAVDSGDVLLEWEPQPGMDKPPVPLLKDKFSSERRKAKMLNFSIAYGKTAVGLAKDWKVSVEEAEETLRLWYQDRQEVREWQEERKKEAEKTFRVHTLLGRSRHLPDANSSNRSLKSHALRAAINTPVQGSAADVAMCAMLEINRNKELKELGWKLLLQVHDEVILEGPTESVVRAKELVVQSMSYPFGGQNLLSVALSVDADYAGSWYAAK